LTNAAGMFDGASLSTTIYESPLTDWATQNLQPGVTFTGGNSQHCSDAAIAAKAKMMHVNDWTITDGGQDCAEATTPPTVATSVASSVGETVASLNGMADPNGASTSAWFQWGTSTAYGNVTPGTSVGSGTSAMSYSFNLSSLQCGTTYCFRAVAENVGGVTHGMSYSFTTADCALSDVIFGGGFETD